MHRSISSPVSTAKRWQILVVLLGTIVVGYGIRGLAQTSSSPAGGAVAVDKEQAKSQIQAAGQAAANKIEVLWQRIDERRLKNRTPDELVAWGIMGLLVGSLLYRFGRSSQLMSIVLGLVGSFVGGIVANVTQLDLGLGPVLIRYEDLLCTLAGGVLMLCGARWSTLMKLIKPRVP